METRWAGKRVYTFGDSIMAQDQKPFEPANPEYNQDKVGMICRGYQTLLKERLGIDVVQDFAVGGQGVRDQMKIALEQDFRDIDIVLISVGVNNFSAGTPIGSIPATKEETHDDTFIGDYCTMMDHIYRSNPKVKIILMTPLHRDTTHRKGNTPINDIQTRIHGNVLADYADAIKEIGSFYACPVVDMYRESGLNRFNLPLFTFEGVHPTNEGYEFIIQPLIHAFEKI